MTNQHDAAQFEGIEPGVEVSGVVGEHIRDVGLAGAAHSDELGREQPPGADAGQDLSP
jgi:hypothetical protein